MELLSHSSKFTDDKELAWFYLNNLTENSKTTIFTIYPLSDTTFYESSNAVITYLKSFISSNIRINALNDIRTLKMTENGGLYAHYKSFNRLVSELGAGALSNEVQVNYFIAGLNSNAVHNTNLNLHMHTFFENKPSATVTDLYAEADKVISLSKTNSGNNGLGKRAGPERGGPRSQQRNTGFKQRPYDGNTQSRKRETFAKKRPNQDTSQKDVVCNKCHNKGHIAANCKSVYTNTGKFIGTKGEPPASHYYWTKRNAEEASEKEVLRQEKAAMVKKTAPPQPAQQKRKKTVQALTLADPLASSVLAALGNSDISEFSDAASDFTVDERTVGPSADKTNISERTVIEFFDKTTSSKPNSTNTHWSQN
jgi:hypothetical protein